MKIENRVALTELRKVAHDHIDAAAERVRLRFMSAYIGQVTVYGEKKREAELYLSDPGIDKSAIPHLVAESVMNKVTLKQMANVFLDANNQARQYWMRVSPKIEVRRLTAKRAVDEATTPAAIKAASVVSWDDLFNL